MSDITIFKMQRTLQLMHRLTLQQHEHEH